MADWDTTSPADDDIVSQYPSNERSARAATRTNFGVDHHETDDGDVGKHEVVKLLAQSAQSGTAGEGKLYVKNVGSGVIELFYVDHAGNEIQLTDGGDITGVVAASTTVAGIVELATQAEADAQLSGSRAVPPASLANYLLGSNNLSELTSLSTARSNLNLGSLATLDTVGSSQINSNAVGQAELSGGAVARVHLDTALGSTSGLITSGATINITLNAYSFFPMIHGPNGQVELRAHSTDGSSANAPRFAIHNLSGVGTSYDIDHRYVAS